MILWLFYSMCLCNFPIAPEGSISYPLIRNISTQNSLLTHAHYALRPKGVGGWCPHEDALHSGSISTISAVLINQKTGGRSRNTGGVCGSRGAGASERRDGRPEGEPEPEEQVSLMGEAVSGRCVQRKEGDKLRNWGVCGCGPDSCFIVTVLFESVFSGWRRFILLMPSITFLSMYRCFSQGRGALVQLLSHQQTQSFSMNGLVRCGIASLKHNITRVGTYQSCDPENNRPSVRPVPFKSPACSMGAKLHY